MMCEFIVTLYEGVADEFSAEPAAGVGMGRCIIVETNYRIYAYTTSALQEQVLSLSLSFSLILVADDLLVRS